MNLEWRKSSYSGAQNNCAEVRATPDGNVQVRDSKNPAGPVLRFSADTWRAFLGAVKSSSISA